MRNRALQNDDDIPIEPASQNLETVKRDIEPVWTCDTDEDGMEQSSGGKTSNDGMEPNAMSCETKEGEVSTVEIERVKQPATVKPMAGRKRKYFMAKLKVSITAQ